MPFYTVKVVVFSNIVTVSGQEIVEVIDVLQKRKPVIATEINRR